MSAAAPGGEGAVNLDEENEEDLDVSNVKLHKGAATPEPSDAKKEKKKKEPRARSTSLPPEDGHKSSARAEFADSKVLAGIIKAAKQSSKHLGNVAPDGNVTPPMRADKEEDVLPPRSPGLEVQSSDKGGAPLRTAGHKPGKRAKSESSDSKDSASSTNVSSIAGLTATTDRSRTD